MDKWVSTWAYCTLDFRQFQTLVGEETQRVMLKNNISGDQVRLHFSNAYGLEPVTFDSVNLCLSRDMITAETAGAAAVTFAGAPRVTLAPGEKRVSDPVPLSVRAGDILCVTTYMRERCLITSASSSYPQPISRVYNSLPGDYSRRPYFPVRPQRDYFRPVKEENEVSVIYGLERVDVRYSSPARTIVLFGDSITHHSRWSGPFADRLYRAFPGCYSVLNCAIGGNRILNDAYPLSGYGSLFGPAGLSRFETDVFGPGLAADLVVCLEGVNDILHPAAHYAPAREAVTAQELIGGLSQYARICHAHHVPAVACTLMPFYNFLGCCTAQQEAIRQQVNQWLRAGLAFDHLLDFDAMTRDKADPRRLSPQWDSGDNIHPGQAGGIHIAYSIDLDPLLKLIEP